MNAKEQSVKMSLLGNQNKRILMKLIILSKKSLKSNLMTELKKMYNKLFISKNKIVDEKAQKKYN